MKNEKKEIIKAILADIRNIRRNDARKRFIEKEYNLTNETWKIKCFTFKSVVETECTVVLSNGVTCNYPRTSWGDYGTRWDSDFKKFLEREIQKA